MFDNHGTMLLTTTTARQKFPCSFKLVIPSGARNLRPARQEIPRFSRNDKLVGYLCRGVLPFFDNSGLVYWMIIIIAKVRVLAKKALLYSDDNNWMPEP